MFAGLDFCTTFAHAFGNKQAECPIKHDDP